MNAVIFKETIDAWRNPIKSDPTLTFAFIDKWKCNRYIRLNLGWNELYVFILFVCGYLYSVILTRSMT